MGVQEFLHKLLSGERDGTVLWKIPLGEIDYPPITDPAEGVAVATLAENMLRLGQLQPLLLSKIKGAKNGASYRLIAGRRRLEALRMLGKTHASAIVITCKEEEVALLELSDNFMAREMDVWRAADALANSMEAGFALSKLSRLLGQSTEVLDQLLQLRDLPSQQKRLLKLLGASMQDALAFLKLSESVRLPLLKRAIEEPCKSLSAYVDEYLHNPIPSALQMHKVWSADVRLFANTLQRSVETMEKAGFYCEVLQEDDETGHTFTVRLTKPQNHPHSTDNVSRETFIEEEYEQISLPLDEKIGEKRCGIEIFRAIAEDEVRYAEIVHEQSVSENVSRETLEIGNLIKRKSRKKRENAEKLEICIDEPMK